MYINKSYVEADWSVGNVTAPIILSPRNGAGLLQIVVTGTIDLTIQGTNYDIQSGATPTYTAYSSDATSVTANKMVQMPVSPRAIRILVNSFTGGATVSLNYVQSDV